MPASAISSTSAVSRARGTSRAATAARAHGLVDVAVRAAKVAAERGLERALEGHAHARQPVGPYELGEARLGEHDPWH